MDKRQIVAEVLQKSNNNKEAKEALIKNSIKILCPFHKDSHPSCTIMLQEGYDIPFGVFNCFGCGKSGHFFILAEKLLKNNYPNTLLKVKQYIDNKWFKEKDIDHPIIELDDGWEDIIIERKVGLEDNIDIFELNLSEFCKLYNSRYVINEESYQILKNSYLIPEEMIFWRGIKRNVLNAFEARYYFDKQFGDFKLFFPWILNDCIIGGTRVNLQKSNYSYLDCKFSPKFKYMFPYDLVIKMINKWKFKGVVLVEGFRDALSLIQNKIPALATLGTQTWNKDYSDKYKINLLLSLGIKNVVLFFDQDNAGKLATEIVKKDLTNNTYFNVYDISNRIPKNIKDPNELISKFEIVWIRVKKVLQKLIWD